MHIASPAEIPSSLAISTLLASSTSLSIDGACVAGSTTSSEPVVGDSLADFVDHVASLREQRFAGADLIVAKRDHTFLLTVGFFGCFGGWRLQNSHPGGEKIVCLPS